MDKDGLITVQEFNAQVMAWALRVKRSAQQTLDSKTHSTGRLREWLTQFVDKNDDNAPAYKVKFQFERYGVFRAYGAGRGYVCISGRLVRGYRIRSVRDVKERRWSDVAKAYLQRGYSHGQVNRLKVYVNNQSGAVLREPLDWIDIHVHESIETLADSVQEFYGDEALRSLSKDLKKITILKK